MGRTLVIGSRPEHPYCLVDPREAVIGAGNFPHSLVNDLVEEHGLAAFLVAEVDGNFFLAILHGLDPDILNGEVQVVPAAEIGDAEPFLSKVLVEIADVRHCC